MRKVVLFAMLILGVVSAHAQWKITPEAGMNVTKYKNEGAKAGFKAGAAVSYTFESKWFSLQSGLYYVQRGKAQSSYTEIYGSRLGEDGERHSASISIYPAQGGSQGGWSAYGLGTDNSNNGYGGGYGYGGGLGYGYYGNGLCLHDLDFSGFEIEGMKYYRNREHRGYLQLPVLARFNWDISPDIRLHLAAGPYFAYGVSGNYAFDVVDWRQGSLIPAEKKESWNPFNSVRGSSTPRFDWGMALEIGAEVKRFSFKLGYDVGFGRNYRYDDDDPKYHTVSFTVGYTF